LGESFRSEPIISGDENVYSPNDDSYLIADCLDIRERSFVLDMGTGTGILGIKATQLGARRVLAVDINPSASRCAVRNIKLNGLVDQIGVLTSDLFSSLREGAWFDVVVFNPPYLKTPESEQTQGWLERSWAGGPNGREVLNRFIACLPKYLKTDGKLFIIHPSYGVRTTIRILKGLGMKVITIAEKKLFFERLLVLVAKFDKDSR
jgi:release factor glutamine methyltransferase